MVRGQRRNGVYYWPKSVPLRSAALTLSSSIPSSSSVISLWNSRLRHPSSRIFCKFLSVLDISFSQDQVSFFLCKSYNINKSHTLPSDKYRITSSSLLDLIFFDVWSSTVSSTDGYKHYVIFIDHCTKYIWHYPLRRKSDVHSTFLAFKQLVENYISTKIKLMFIDNWGSF